jgi:hypothetical protein
LALNGIGSARRQEPFEANEQMVDQSMAVPAGLLTLGLPFSLTYRVLVSDERFRAGIMVPY